jgi:hypothetical protein
MSRVQTIAISLLCSLLALLFIVSGLSGLMSPSVHGVLVLNEYPAWARLLVGGIEVGAGCMLLFPRLVWRAAAVLGTLTSGLGVLSLQREETAAAALAAVILGFLALVGVASYRRFSVVHRLRAAVDWVAEHEIAESRLRSTTPMPRRRPVTPRAVRASGAS